MAKSKESAKPSSLPAAPPAPYQFGPLDSKGTFSAAIIANALSCSLVEGLASQGARTLKDTMAAATGLSTGVASGAGKHSSPSDRLPAISPKLRAPAAIGAASVMTTAAKAGRSMMSAYLPMALQERGISHGWANTLTAAGTTALDTVRKGFSVACQDIAAGTPLPRTARGLAGAMFQGSPIQLVMGFGASKLFLATFDGMTSAIGRDASHRRPVSLGEAGLIVGATGAATAAIQAPALGLTHLWRLTSREVPRAAGQTLLAHNAQLARAMFRKPQVVRAALLNPAFFAAFLVSGMASASINVAARYGVTYKWSDFGDNTPPPPACPTPLPPSAVTPSAPAAASPHKAPVASMPQATQQKAAAISAIHHPPTPVRLTGVEQPQAASPAARNQAAAKDNCERC